MMNDFIYVRPNCAEDAGKVLGEHREAKALAGGMSLLPVMKLRLAAPSHLVDLGRLPDLSRIEVESDSILIGSMARHAEVARAVEIRQHFPALAALASGIGDRQVRHRGTLGGSVANADPSACYPSALLAVSATIETTQRSIPADQFFVGLYETALNEDEIITAVRFPRPQRAGYAKFPHPASRFAIVGVFVADFGSGDVRVAVTGAGPSVFRETQLEKALTEEFTPEAARMVRVPDGDLNTDLAASAAYRAHLIPVMAARAITFALQPLFTE